MPQSLKRASRGLPKPQSTFAGLRYRQAHARCFVEYDPHGCAAEADLFHLHATPAHRGSGILLTVILNCDRHFGHDLALLDDGGLVLQLQFVVACLQFRPINHDGFVERNVVAGGGARNSQRNGSKSEYDILNHNCNSSM